MDRTVDYYFSVASPWTWLGSARFLALARRSGARVNVRPMDFACVLAASGGLPYQQRPPQRASYRQVDLARWQRRLGIPLTLEPKFYPVDREPASRMVIAARELGQHPALELSHAILRAIWQEDRDIADWPTLAAVAREAGFDGSALARAGRWPRVPARHRAGAAGPGVRGTDLGGGRRALLGAGPAGFPRGEAAGLTASSRHRRAAFHHESHMKP